MTATRSAPKRADGRRVPVVADDGVPLDVRVRGRAGPLVILSHGFTTDSEDWAAELPALRGRARVVTWDHRGHGRSGWGDPTRGTVEQTGRDLAAVVEAVSRPDEPVVLVGHSMGGMSILALARRHPEWFGTRVRGALLVATSAGELVRDGPLGLAHVAARRLGAMPAVAAGARLAAPFADRLPWRDSRLGRWAMRRMLFTGEATEQEVHRAQERVERLPLAVGSAFGAALLSFDGTPALPVLARVPVTVVVAGADRMTPAGHGERLVEALGPDARLVRVEEAAHAVNLTHHEAVDDALAGLLERARLR